jgi:hypothetical protein
LGFSLEAFLNVIASRCPYMGARATRQAATRPTKSEPGGAQQRAELLALRCLEGACCMNETLSLSGGRMLHE